MARPPQYPLSEPDSLAVARVKEAIKGLSPEGRAFVLAWIVKFYNDRGSMFSPSIVQRRQQVTINNEEFWLVSMPRRK
jgi:hypothetical protein